MHPKAFLIRIWAVASILFVLGVIAFLFLFVLANGASVITPAFLLESPRGAVLGSEGGIFPAIIGSFWFTGAALLFSGIPAIATAILIVFYVRNRHLSWSIRLIVQCIAGVPSIVLGLFSYSFLVRDLGLGRCILASSSALAVMILPFIEVRAEKAFREVPRELLESSYALGCSRSHTILKIVLPYCMGELISALILGGCFAMGATPPLIFTGGVAFAALPESVFSPAMALPLHLYLLLAQGATSMDTAYGTAFVMMAILLLSNALAMAFAGVWKRKFR